jgi:SAM-dependent methyltransferase
VDDALEINRRFWDGLANVHANAKPGSYYDIEALIRGKRPLGDAEQEALDIAYADVSGLDVLHVQSHIGIDSIILAQRGARVTAVDFSPRALDAGRAIASRAGVEVKWIQADANALPAELEGRFDLAWVTIGAICWIEDLAAWTAGVARTLRPGGRLIIVEMHPLFQMVEGSDPFTVDMPYAFAGAHVFDEDGSYADLDAKLPATTSVVYAHSLGETVNAAVDAGLVVERLEEHLDVEADPRGDALERGDDGRYRLLVSGHALPLLFTLVARKG